jgi:hypothetical protein
MIIKVFFLHFGTNLIEERIVYLEEDSLKAYSLRLFHTKAVNVLQPSTTTVLDRQMWMDFSILVFTASLVVVECSYHGSSVLKVLQYIKGSKAVKL